MAARLGCREASFTSRGAGPVAECTSSVAWRQDGTQFQWPQSCRDEDQVLRRVPEAGRGLAACGFPETCEGQAGCEEADLGRLALQALGSVLHAIEGAFSDLSQAL